LKEKEERLFVQKSDEESVEEGENSSNEEVRILPFSEFREVISRN
jgi:hypothetical protein